MSCCCYGSGDTLHTPPVAQTQLPLVSQAVAQEEEEEDSEGNFWIYIYLIGF
jgi:hypothetical protein